MQAVFFDLDGTLLDTARDMACALNRLLDEEGQQLLPDYDLIRSEVSHGARAMIHLAFEEKEDSERFNRLRQRFLDIYRADIHNETTLFPNMGEILNILESVNIMWGIVTNKPSWLTLPLLESMNLKQRAATIVCADTAGMAKPDPGPVLNACHEVNVTPGRCIYIGDDERDVQAAHGAGMPCIIMRSGYIRYGQQPDNWGADMVMDNTEELLGWVKQTIKKTGQGERR